MNNHNDQEELFDADSTEQTTNGDDAADLAPSFIPLKEPRDFAWKLSDPTLGGLRGTNPHPGFGTFELNLNSSLAEQLGPFFDSLETAPLTSENIKKIKKGAEGVYALYIDRALSYVGKSNAKKGLKQRLTRHRRKLSNRENITVDDVQFKAAQIYSFSAFNVEGLLLLLTRERALHLLQGKYAHDLVAWETKQAAILAEKPSRSLELKYAEWKELSQQHRAKRPKQPKIEDVKPPFLNNSGFGSNDTGTERDTQKTSLFDKEYPLDVDSVVDAQSMSIERTPEAARRKGLPASTSLLIALDWFGENVSFTFRVSVASKEPLRHVIVDVDTLFSPAPMRTVLARISRLCPSGWTITIMKGKVLIHEGEKNLKDVQLHLRSGQEVQPDEGKPAAEN
jgi:hypothetical protein